VEFDYELLLNNIICIKIQFVNILFNVLIYS